ncbi:MAG: GTPase Era [Thermaerobacter sp.]|nr:GTPase Era [Bacillota bacterium]REJ38321.1 MAG: GTPase Era [Bacillota bacterium]
MSGGAAGGPVTGGPALGGPAVGGPAAGGEFRSGFAAIVGRPNVGKSTLLNRLVGRKLAIVSDKPQTTRTRILGVVNRPGAQIVLVDTPGVHRPRHRLGEQMVRTARNALSEVEAVLFVVDASAGPPGAGDRFVADLLAPLETPVVLVLNKVDAVPGDRVDELLEAYGALGRFHAALPVSALTGFNVERLVEVVVDLLPPGPRYFPEDMITDQPERQIIAEFVREQILHLTREEVPHSVAVVVEEVRDRGEDKPTYVRAVIYVERDSQKGILIGQGGRVLKEVGTRARRELEALLGMRLYLELWVKVKPDWRNRPGSLQEFGYVDT